MFQPFSGKKIQVPSQEVFSKKYFSQGTPEGIARQHLACKYYGNKMEVPDFDELRTYEYDQSDIDGDGNYECNWETTFNVPNFNPDTREKIDPYQEGYLDMMFRVRLYGNKVTIHQGFSTLMCVYAIDCPREGYCFDDLVTKTFDLEDVSEKFQNQELRGIEYDPAVVYEPDYSPAKPSYKPASDYSPGRSV